MSQEGEPPSSPLTPSRDFVPLAVASVVFAILLGTAIMTVSLLFNRSMVQALPLDATAQPDVSQPAATVLLVGVMATLITPMVVAWVLLAPINVMYRRFGFAMVSGLGALLVSLVSVPANEFFGVRGLAALLVITLLALPFLGRKVLRERRAA